MLVAERPIKTAGNVRKRNPARAGLQDVGRYPAFKIELLKDDDIDLGQQPGDILLRTVLVLRIEQNNRLIELRRDVIPVNPPQCLGLAVVEKSYSNRHAKTFGPLIRRK